MKKRAIILGTLLTVSAAFTTATFAFNPQGGNMTEDEKTAHRAEMQVVFESNDYVAFQEAVKETPMAEYIDSEEKFEKFVTMHKLMEEARLIREELGLPEKGMRKWQNWKMKGSWEWRMKGKNGWDGNREQMKAVLEGGDYEAFKTTAEGTPLADTIDSEEKFQKLIQAHEALIAGDKDTANEIRDELGLKAPRSGKGKRGQQTPQAE